jgi:catechol 2,3-dioxygenase-like lactoylglutathione lyase family enzyme
MSFEASQEESMTESVGKTRISDVRTVGVPVADQDRAVAFYVEKLGFEKRMDGEFGEGQRWVEVAPPGATTSIALERQGEAGQTGIDTQVRFATEDAAADHAELLAQGVDVDPEIISFPVPMFAFRDADGNRLVIVEEPKNS